MISSYIHIDNWSNLTGWMLYSNALINVYKGTTSPTFPDKPLTFVKRNNLSPEGCSVRHYTSLVYFSLVSRTKSIKIKKCYSMYSCKDTPFLFFFDKSIHFVPSWRSWRWTKASFAPGNLTLLGCKWVLKTDIHTHKHSDSSQTEIAHT